jgi:formylglycine-generating enzyme required for sulfatase activity
MNAYAMPFLKLRAMTLIATIALGYSQPGAPKPGSPSNSVKTNPKDGLTYVWIQPGTFMMGCSAGDGACESIEKPAHQVTITKGFWIGQTEVTQAAYERVVGENPSHARGASLPVEMIEWREAKAYCHAVGMRLPTEAEWEYAARGGSASARYGKLDAVAWYSGNSGNITHEVGKKQANAYGLYDMLGNVFEWVGDWYDEESYASGPATDPKGPEFADEAQAIMSGRQVVIRGSADGQYYRDTRVSDRKLATPIISVTNIGVRCAGN